MSICLSTYLTVETICFASLLSPWGGGRVLVDRQFQSKSRMRSEEGKAGETEVSPSLGQRPIPLERLCPEHPRQWARGFCVHTCPSHALHLPCCPGLLQPLAVGGILYWTILFRRWHLLTHSRRP